MLRSLIQAACDSISQGRFNAQLLCVESALRNAITVHFNFAGPKAKKRKGTKKGRETSEEIVNKVEQMQGTPEFFCHNILS